MSTAWNFWTADFARRLSDASEQSIRPEDIVTPPDQKLGDLAYGCFKLAKVFGKSPAEIAKDIASKVELEHSDFISVTAAGPYVNATLRIGDAVRRVIRDIEVAGNNYGAIGLYERPSDVRKIVLEYAQPNTHKEIHVGHLRNLVLGSSLHAILNHAGWKCIPVSYHGDVGAHVAKCLWWIKKSGKEMVKTGEFLGRMYTEASQELEAHPEYKEEVSEVQRKLEAHDPEWEALWLETRRWSLDEMAEIFDDLGVKIERQYLESEVVDRGQEMVDHLIKKGIAKESQGAMVVDLEDVKLGVFLVRKSDGTSLYATKDLALAEKKAEEYPDALRSLILVDNRQSFYFKQLFETLKRMGIKTPHEFIGYEFVTLKSGAMSSREGNIVTYQSFREEVIKYASKEVTDRHAEHGWSVGKVEHTAWTLAMAGMKFGMLKQDNDKIFTFDLEQAMSFDGDTGPYCQYAATRLASILKKAGELPETDAALSDAFDHESEKSLALALADFPTRIELSAREMRPSVIAQWCLKTAQAINAFYRDVPVLESEGSLRESRLRLAAASRHALAMGLGLLGIPLPDEM
ncbi:arginine--tRNA ligase [Candidatus Uhrbacteria bacterium]|nr:arginine--tRNA ligase [Candidatus Uhrbacteria bacterium]